MAGSCQPKREGETPHPGERKHSLQHDGKLDGRIRVRVGTWNLSCPSRKRVVCEEL